MDGGVKPGGTARARDHQETFRHSLPQLQGNFQPQTCLCLWCRMSLRNTWWNKTPRLLCWFSAYLRFILFLSTLGILSNTKGKEKGNGINSRLERKRFLVKWRNEAVPKCIFTVIFLLQWRYFPCLWRMRFFWQRWQLKNFFPGSLGVVLLIRSKSAFGTLGQSQANHWFVENQESTSLRDVAISGFLSFCIQQNN